MSEQPKIELRGVVKSFGSNHVLRDVNFAVQPGESLTIIPTGQKSSNQLFTFAESVDVRSID